MSTPETRRVSASVGRLVATLPAALTGDPSSSLGEESTEEYASISEAVTTRHSSIWEGVRALRNDIGVTEEGVGEVVRRSWGDRAFRPEKASASENSDREVLAAHDAETHQLPQSPERKKSKIRSTRCVTICTSHLWTYYPPVRARRGRSAFSAESETREGAKARQRGQSGPGVAAWLRARTVDTSRVITAPVRRAATSIWGSRTTWRRRVPSVFAADANTRHARLCHRASPRRSKPTTPAVGPRDPLLPEAGVRRPPSGKQCALYNADRDRHRYRQGRPPRRIGIGFSDTRAYSPT